MAVSRPAVPQHRRSAAPRRPRSGPDRTGVR